MARMPDGMVVFIEANRLDVRITGSRELVKCRSCVYYGEEPEGDVMICYRGLGQVNPDDYCSRAVVKVVRADGEA